MIEINMQMPEKCGLCPCFHFDNPMYCQAVKADKDKKIVNPYGSPRPEWCPLKEQEPILLENQHKPYGISTNANSPWISKCPRCGKKVEGRQTKFCKYCGQGVKWNE